MGRFPLTRMNAVDITVSYLNGVTVYPERSFPGFLLTAMIYTGNCL
jgi:hypothetical protein